MNRALVPMVTAMVLAGIGVATAAVIVEDPGFEGAGQGPWDGWVANPNMSRDFDSTVEKHGGQQSLMITWNEYVAEWESAVEIQTFAVTPGEDWYVEAYVKITEPLGNAFAYLETIFRDSGSQEVGKMQSAWLSDVTDWTRLQVAGTVSNSAVSAAIQLVTLPWVGGSSAGTMYWDDVSGGQNDGQVPEPATLSLICLALAAVQATRRRHAVS